MAEVESVPHFRCYWCQCDDGTMAFIPNCWGGAIEGPAGCTCGVAGSRLEQAQAARAEAERIVERFIEKREARNGYIEELFNRIHHMRKRIADLEAQIERQGVQ